MASAPFLASASEEVIYNHHERIDVRLEPDSGFTVLLDQQIAMGPVSSIDSVTVNVDLTKIPEYLNHKLTSAFDLDINLIAPDGQTFHLYSNRATFVDAHILPGAYIFNGTAEQTLYDSKIRDSYNVYIMNPGTYRAESWPTGSWPAGNWRLHIFDAGHSSSFRGIVTRAFNSITVRGTLDRSNNETFFSKTYDKLVLSPSDSIEETFALGPVDYIDTLTLVGNHSRVRDLTFKLIAPDGQEFVAINKPDMNGNLGYINHSLDEINYSYDFSVHGFNTVSSSRDLPDGQTTDYVVGHGSKQFESWPTIPENGWDAGEWRILYVDDTAGEGGWLKSISLTGGLRPDPITPWQVWLNAHFGNSDAAQELADPDNDGRVNLAEYAFNLDPNDATDSNVHGLRIEAPEGAPALIYRKNKDASDVRYTLEQTADLASPNWQPAELEAENILSEVGSTLEMRAATSNPVSNKYFYRLRIEFE
ncbi:MAG: hypothetical protein O2827_01605 [Verrucomicrobia bacterium]|nr:hypothetical protein [Verrucomicrobiota bacterium]